MTNQHYYQNRISNTCGLGTGQGKVLSGVLGIDEHSLNLESRLLQTNIHEDWTRVPSKRRVGPATRIAVTNYPRSTPHNVPGPDDRLEPSDQPPPPRPDVALVVT